MLDPSLDEIIALQGKGPITDLSVLHGDFCRQRNPSKIFWRHSMSGVATRGPWPVPAKFRMPGHTPAGPDKRYGIRGDLCPISGAKGSATVTPDKLFATIHRRSVDRKSIVVSGISDWVERAVPTVETVSWAVSRQESIAHAMAFHPAWAPPSTAQGASLAVTAIATGPRR